MPRLWIANDHAAFSLKEVLVETARALGWQVEDRGAQPGPEPGQSVDYPDQADALAALFDGQGADRGLLICGSGIGISIAANRHAHLRAALCCDVTSARLSRQHNDANVLCLGARLIGVETAKATLTTFLSEPFEGGRHARRVEKLGRKSRHKSGSESGSESGNRLGK